MAKAVSRAFKRESCAFAHAIFFTHTYICFVHPPIDCSDGSDESTECQQRKNPCPETKCPKPAKCANLPNKVECICPKGYTFDETTNKCEVSISIMY